MPMAMAMASVAELDQWFQAAYDFTKQAGEMVRAANKKAKSIQTKASPIDLVTETDKDVEIFLISNLKTKFPDHRFIGEESVSAGSKCNLTDAPTWIIDPIDGTMNFVHGFPYFAISIGLTVNKNPVIGIVYNPILDQMYSAKSGQGAFLNGERLQVSGQEDLSQSMVFAEVGTNPDPKKMDCVWSNVQTLVPQVHSVRMMGSAAIQMCMVAQGCVDAYYSFGIHCWDVVAAWLLVTEAGGVVIDNAGGPFDLMSRRVLCAGSRVLAEKLASQLKQYQPVRDD